MANERQRQGWRKAKRDGAKAMREGKLPEDNPWKISDTGNNSWWTSGWWEAENEAAVREGRAVRTINGGCVLIGDNIERQKLFENGQDVNK
jgi:hypothetical protein